MSAAKYTAEDAARMALFLLVKLLYVAAILFFLFGALFHGDDAAQFGLAFTLIVGLSFDVWLLARRVRKLEQR